MTASVACPLPYEVEAHPGAARHDPRYTAISRLIEELRDRDELTFTLRVDETRHRIQWPVDFSGYHVTDRPRPRPLQIFNRLELPGADLLRAHLLRSDLDLLAYFTCNSERYLQNCQDRMDWFFYLDYHVDGPATPQRDREQAVSDLLTWIDHPRWRSRLPWVNNVTTMLGALVEELERDGLDTRPLLQDTRGYVQAFLREYDDTLSLESYLENRANSIGVKPEVEFCFAYLDQPLSQVERGRASMMKHLASYLITLHNDACSEAKEKGQEHGHVNLKSFFPKSHEFVAFLNDTYRDIYAAFLALRPRRPGALERFWKVCHHWLCGSLVWHLTSRRYDLGQLEITL